jgi:hypothetical protein
MHVQGVRGLLTNEQSNEVTSYLDKEGERKKL